MKSPRAAMPPARLPPPVVASALAGVFTSVLAGVFTSAAAGEPGPWLDPGAASPQPVQAAVALLQPPGGAEGPEKLKWGPALLPASPEQSPRRCT